jgi:hypothetical protein
VAGSQTPSFNSTARGSFPDVVVRKVPTASHRPTATQSTAARLASWWDVTAPVGRGIVDVAAQTPLVSVTTTGSKPLEVS